MILRCCSDIFVEPQFLKACCEMMKGVWGGYWALTRQKDGQGRSQLSYLHIGFRNLYGPLRTIKNHWQSRETGLGVEKAFKASSKPAAMINRTGSGCVLYCIVMQLQLSRALQKWLNNVGSQHKTTLIGLCGRCTCHNEGLHRCRFDGILNI